MAVAIRNLNFAVVRFVPFAKGTVDAGAATGVRKLFFQALSLAVPKIFFAHIASNILTAGLVPRGTLKNTKGRLPAALCVLSGECVFGEASWLLFI